MVFGLLFIVLALATKLIGSERFLRGRGFYPDTPVHVVTNAVQALAHALREFLAGVCEEESNKKFIKHKNLELDAEHQLDGSSCLIDTAEREEYSVHVMQQFGSLATKDGTLDHFNTTYSRKRNKVGYEIRQYRKRGEGNYVNARVGTWGVHHTKDILPEEELRRHGRRYINFRMGSTADNTQRLLCSQACRPGEIRVRDQNEEKKRCCWTCTPCPESEISWNDTCLKCLKIERVVNNTCQTLEERFLSIGGPQVDVLLIFYLLFVAVGLFMVVFVTVLFICFNDNRIVRCSGRDLCYMILLGLGLLFLCPVAYMIRPSMVGCVVRGALPGLSFLLCYAPLFLRASRIYRIFVRAKKSISRPSLISPRSQVFAIFGIVSVQALLAGVWFASKSPVPHYVVSQDRTYMTVQCAGDVNPISMLVNLALSVGFMLSCTYLAFKTRHFPKNYNEAKFIGVTLYITCVIWAVFLPAYYLTPENELFLRDYLLCALCLAIGFVTLIGLFGKKVRLLLCPRPTDSDHSSQQMWSFSHSTDTHYCDQSPPTAVGLKD